MHVIKCIFGMLPPVSLINFRSLTCIPDLSEVNVRGGCCNNSACRSKSYERSIGDIAYESVA